MLMLNQLFSDVLDGAAMQRWPGESLGVMQQLLTTEIPPINRRKLHRNRYHLQTDLLTTGLAGRSFSVFTRDISAWNVGFVGSMPISPAIKTVIRLLAPDGRRTAVGCRIRRCREFRPGWFDCYAEFCQPQYPFDRLCEA